MVLKLNNSYVSSGGFIIPRSHLKDEKGEKYCIVQVLTGGTKHYTSRHTTMSSKELKKALGISMKERIEIL